MSCIDQAVWAVVPCPTYGPGHVCRTYPKDWYLQLNGYARGTHDRFDPTRKNRPYEAKIKF